MNPLAIALHFPFGDHSQNSLTTGFLNGLCHNKGKTLVVAALLHFSFPVGLPPPGTPPRPGGGPPPEPPCGRVRAAATRGRGGWSGGGGGQPPGSAKVHLVPPAASGALNRLCRRLQKLPMENALAFLDSEVCSSWDRARKPPSSRTGLPEPRPPGVGDWQKCIPGLGVSWNFSTRARILRIYAKNPPAQWSYGALGGDFDSFPNRIRPKFGPEARFAARGHYCVT